jgi:hypothetical protein
VGLEAEEQPMRGIKIQERSFVVELFKFGSCRLQRDKPYLKRAWNCLWRWCFGSLAELCAG